MPFTATFMGKKKPRPSTRDELSVVKAAAWTWYQRGSGSEGKPVGEFNIRRMQSVIYRPSRYKLEAMKIAEQEDAATDDSQISSTGPVHCHADGNSLLDKFEIESISKRLDQLIDSTTASKLFSDGDHADHADDNRQKTLSRNSSNSSNAGTTVKKKSKKLSGGFWLRHGVICGTREDVVISRLPEKRSAAVKLATCRPRVTHA